jgi:hypothetical protein
MPNHARGPFEVRMTPQAPTAEKTDPSLGRMALDKNYRGDLEAVGIGEMLTAMTPVKGSAVYVAVERVTGMLAGRTGAFSIHHRGIMTRGEPDLTITVVPDSGDGELAGLTGTMRIVIEGGKHFYEFDYELPDGP